MTGWSIEPGPVRKVLEEVEAEQQALRRIIRSAEAHDTTSTTPGAEAIAEFLRGRVPGLEWVDTQITRVVDATSGALQAYDAGDETAAGIYQRAASTVGAPTPQPHPHAQAPLGPPTPQ
ncbi:DUF6507 family protein [Myceligenerans indicum]|uniref:PE family protein n=1 Tax=Myceligenerans indicum TaxID=2593663 RepID=A0ABS1LHF0_9MICO|nr:DUF6507 family protein [Myceligenerans indicum]MBL0885563.1 hypothetical protein [Myceligenerans indicum]